MPAGEICDNELDVEVVSGGIGRMFSYGRSKLSAFYWGGDVPTPGIRFASQSWIVVK